MKATETALKVGDNVIWVHDTPKKHRVIIADKDIPAEQQVSGLVYPDRDCDFIIIGAEGGQGVSVYAKDLRALTYQDRIDLLHFETLKRYSEFMRVDDEAIRVPYQEKEKKEKLTALSREKREEWTKSHNEYINFKIFVEKQQIDKERPFANN